jgi:hypothetical protein
MCELVALPSCKAPERGFRSARSLARLTVLGEAWLTAEEGTGYAESVVTPSVSARGVEKELTVGQMKKDRKEATTHIWHFGHSSLPAGCPQPPLHGRPPMAAAALDESRLVRAAPDTLDSRVRGTILQAQRREWKT